MDGLEDWKVNPAYHGDTQEMEILRLVGEVARKSNISLEVENTEFWKLWVNFW